MKKTDSINFIIKSFSQLTKEELYAVLKFRLEIFILEQRSFYLDLDDKDQHAMHVMGLEQHNKLVAYGRITADQATAKIWRLGIAQDFRSQGLGARLMDEIMTYINSLTVKKVKLEAQTYLQAFYQKYGFQAVGAPYDDCGVMHIMMQLDR